MSCPQGPPSTESPRAVCGAHPDGLPTRNPSARPPRPRSPCGSSYWRDPVPDDALLETQLYLLAFATGIQDATTFPDYHCFASNQTGNSVLLAVGVFGLGGQIFSLVNIAVSLALFVAGVLMLGQVGNLLGVRKRSWLLASSLLQTAMVFAAAALQFRYGGNGDGPLARLVIALLAFASGAQVAMVRALKITEIPEFLRYDWLLSYAGPE